MPFSTAGSLLSVKALTSSAYSVPNFDRFHCQSLGVKIYIFSVQNQIEAIYRYFRESINLPLLLRSSGASCLGTKGGASGDIIVELENSELSVAAILVGGLKLATSGLPL